MGDKREWYAMQGRRNEKKSGPAIGRGGVRGGATAFIFAFFCMIHINMHVYLCYILGIDENRSRESYVN